MAGVLDSVDLRTKLAGQNRLELLLFRLAGRQRYGINVFKVREVIHCPALTRVPKAKSLVRGIAHLRGSTVSIIDLSMALGGPPIRDLADAFVVITEYNRMVQGFLVHSVDRIVNMEWSAIMSPPAGLGTAAYLTAVTRVEKELVEVIDVEKILAEVMDISSDVSDEIKAQIPEQSVDCHVLVVDDSGVARKQVMRTLDRAGVKYFVATNGREALDMLKTWARDEPEKIASLAMIITDIEMPEMDGYTLTSEIKKDAALDQLFVLLHSSLSGVFNKALVEKVGANLFLAKYNSDELTLAVLERVRQFGGSAAPVAAAG